MVGVVSCFHNFLLHSLAAAWCHLVNFATGLSTLNLLSLFTPHTCFSFSISYIFYSGLETD